jgi:hypothetical protein
VLASIRVRYLALTAFAVLGLLLPAASLASGRDVINDCEEHGELTGSYSKAELQSARNNLPTDLKEYSNCESQIDQAISALRNQAAAKKRSQRNSGGAPAPGGGSPSGGGGSPSSGSAAAGRGGRAPHRVQSSAAFSPPSSQEDKAIDLARFGQDTTVKTKPPVQPGASRPAFQGVKDLPGPLLGLCALLAALGLAAGVLVVVRRVRQRRGPAATAG